MKRANIMENLSDMNGQIVTIYNKWSGDIHHTGQLSYEGGEYFWLKLEGRTDYIRFPISQYIVVAEPQKPL
jgi:hypothetical protein